MKNKNMERCALNNNGGERNSRVAKNSEVQMALEHKMILRLIFGYGDGDSSQRSGKEVA